MTSEIVASTDLPIPARPLRLGVVGCLLGRAQYADALASVPALQIAALADANLGVAQSWARSLSGKPVTYDVLRPLLATEPPLDGILLAVPLEKRAAPLKACLQSGLPTLCSLPLTSALRDTDALTMLVSPPDNHAWLFPILPRRFDPVTSQIAALLASEPLGELRSIRCDLSVPALPAFGVDEDEATTPEGWRILFTDMACQTADLCRLWLGDALTVSADIEGEKSGNVPVRAFGRRGDTTSVANLIVAHERGQATHHITRARSIYLGERYAFTGTNGRLEWTVSVGEAASASVGPSLVLHRTGQRPERLPLLAEGNEEGREGNKALTVSNTFRVRERAGGVSVNGPLVRLIQQFAVCLSSGAHPPVTLADARNATEIVHAAVLASRESIKVSLPIRNPPELGNRV